MDLALVIKYDAEMMSESDHLYYERPPSVRPR